MSRFPVERIDVQAVRIPTEAPESDGTLRWHSTTMVIVRVYAGGDEGTGFSYTHEAAAHIVRETLAPVVCGRDTMSIPEIWCSMVAAVRNIQLQGMVSMAIAAVETALWDLKARILGLPLADLFGRGRDNVPVYGSGGFTSYEIDELQSQLEGWVSTGINQVKMKIGRNPEKDLARVKAAREAIGPQAALFVDANGAFSRKEALGLAYQLADLNVTWFEEPVSSNDLEGLRILSLCAPAGMEIAAGEYGDDTGYFQRMLSAGAVDVLQADVTRCLGYTGFLKAAALAQAHEIPLSAHTAPSIHLPVCCALPSVRHLEYFFDHVRIEEMLFEGVQRPVGGTLSPDLSRPGNGLRLNEAAVQRFATYYEAVQ